MAGAKRSSARDSLWIIVPNPITGPGVGGMAYAAGVSMDSLDAQANVADPRNPEGSIRLDLAKLTAAGFQFETVRAEAKRARRAAKRLAATPSRAVPAPQEG